jgi:putative Holliday junction resolvase
MAVNRNILSLDVGERRVGVAIANSIAKLSSPYKTLINTDQVYEEILSILKNEEIDIIVVGLPQNLSSEDTDQTRYVRLFTDKLKDISKTAVYFENEALSSVRARNTLDESGKPYKKADIDSLAACYILDDFISNNPEVING